jgi:hypothetical protein
MMMTCLNDATDTTISVYVNMTGGASIIPGDLDHLSFQDQIRSGVDVVVHANPGYSADDVLAAATSVHNESQRKVRKIGFAAGQEALSSLGTGTYEP